MTLRVCFRSICDDDHQALLRIYASTRARELAQFPWSDAEKEAFLRMQFRAQHAHYQLQFPTASFELILLDEQIVGRLYVDRSRQEIRLIDIALLPEYRSLGTGTAILRDLMAEARATEKPLMLDVEHNNPARRLYLRLGFQQIGEAWPYYHMALSNPWGLILSQGSIDRN